MATETPELASPARVAERLAIAVSALLLGGALGAFAVGEAASADLKAARQQLEACQQSKGAKP